MNWKAGLLFFAIISLIATTFVLWGNSRQHQDLLRHGLSGQLPNYYRVIKFERFADDFSITIECDPGSFRDIVTSRPFTISQTDVLDCLFQTDAMEFRNCRAKGVSIITDESYSRARISGTSRMLVANAGR